MENTLEIFRSFSVDDDVKIHYYLAGSNVSTGVSMTKCYSGSTCHLPGPQQPIENVKPNHLKSEVRVYIKECVLLMGMMGDGDDGDDQTNHIVTVTLLVPVLCARIRLTV